MTGRILPKSVQSGMKHTEVDNIPLCDIIDACAKGGVTELKFGNIEIKFSVDPRRFVDQITLPYNAPVDIGALKFNTSGTNQASQDSGQNPTFDRDLLEDLRTSQLMIDDPHGFEREVVNSHLRGALNETVQN